MTDDRKSLFLWYFDGTRDKADEIADIGATVAYLKAGGDRGVAWIKDPAPESFENEQWDDDYLRPLTERGIDCRPWFYNWPDTRDQRVIIQALEARWSDVIVLNPETEWRVQSPHSPYNSLVHANAYAKVWVEALRGQIQGWFGKVPRIGYSTCPSWSDFPAEGFEAACDFSMPQHYWPDELMAADGETGSEAGEDMVEAHLRRCGTAKPCYPILTACREYDDDAVVALAANALADYPGLAGFSAWEAGNSAFQADAMRRAFALLPQLSIFIEPIGDTFGPFGKRLAGGFRKFYQSEPKALTYWGFPVTDEIEEAGRVVQYFERARFEWHPGADPANHDVLLGRIGAELREAS